MKKQNLTITPERIEKYAAYLRESERSGSTIRKYVHDLGALAEFLRGRPVSKGALLEWKEELIGQYAPASVNNKLAAINGFLAFCGLNGLRLRKLKIQKSLFLSEEKELAKSEYVRLVRAAERAENERLSLVIQTICATGIRVSELRFITAEAVQTGRAEVANKGKRRTVFLPDKLRKLLKSYLQKQKITAGAVFVSKNGKPPEQYLARYEEAVRERGSGAVQGVPAQSAPPVRAHILCARARPLAPRGHSGPQQCHHHPHLYRRKRRSPRPADRSVGACGHIIFVLLWPRALYIEIIQFLCDPRNTISCVS